MKKHARTLLSSAWLRSFMALAISFAAQGAKAQPSAKTSPPHSQEKQNAFVLKTETVSLMVNVTDAKGRFFSGLEKEAFSVFEDGIEQEISFFTVADSPASIGIVFDVSSSMRGKRIENAREALARFVQSTHSNDEYTLVAFNDTAQLLLDRINNGARVLERAKSILPRGQTALYDAVALALGQVEQGCYTKRALIVISDGEDNRSRISAGKLRRMIQESGVLVYAVAFSAPLSRNRGAMALEELASSSGGSVYKPDNAEQMSEAFERIALELRQLYSVGYAPANFTADGKWRKLKVKITPPSGVPKLKVRSRGGYYAVADGVRRERARTAALD